MSLGSEWKEDLARYNMKRPFLKEQSIWAIWLYRYGKKVDARPAGFMKKIHTTVYWLLFRVIETAVGISLPKSASIGGGLRIWHFGNIFINPDVVIGKNCTLRQGVTIGNRVEGGPVPTIGDNVDFGAYAQVLGGIRIGNGCKIGAMTLVIRDVPDGATAVGVPARIIEASDNSNIIEASFRS
jgi:serine O-acetyltransferase